MLLRVNAVTLITEGLKLKQVRMIAYMLSCGGSDGGREELQEELTDMSVGKSQRGRDGEKNILYLTQKHSF